MGFEPPVVPQAYRSESAEDQLRRQGDLGLVDVFAEGQRQLIDFTVSGGGGCDPPADYVPGSHAEANAATKHDAYHGRFIGIKTYWLVVLSFCFLGGMTKETEFWLQHLINALAAVSTVPRSVIAARVWSIVSVALQKSMAQNALTFRNGRVKRPARRVGQPQAEGPQATGSEPGSQAAEAGSQQTASTGGASDGGSSRSSVAGAALMGRSRSRRGGGGARRGSVGRAAASSILLEAVAGAGGRTGTGTGSQPEGLEPVVASGGTAEPEAGEGVAVDGGLLPL